ncbi:MAG: D-alanyl-D-alanine carboxypeptidase [Microgenomates group bacterium Gr01-1014_7]|nr:MAG: D-alanyl-D-alanine carboxypeptidase [Microgenomates group bacterium Gr01-1014_7]
MQKPTVISAILIILVSLFIVRLTQGGKPQELISPLLKQEKILGINQWLPFVGAGQDALQISAESAFFIDSKIGQVLFANNPKKQLPIASLVKVMTVLVALEHKKMNDSFLVSKRAAEMEPDKMLLIAGEKLSLKELLYGIFLVSANDAAEVIAEETTGDREQFIKLMNSKAKQLGMKDSFFANPTGLDEDGNNSYSSTYDLAILTRYLIRHYPEVVEISQTEHIILPVTETHQDYDMYSGINLLTTYPGIVGFKTGYTPEAGYTIVTLARKDGHEIIGVLLGSEYRRDETKELLDYSFRILP